MTLDKAVSEVKDRLETVGTQAQGAAKQGFKALKAANDVVLNGVQGVVKAQTEAAKELFTLGKESFDKAYAAGLLAVAQNPVEYIPDGRETIVGAFNETVDTLTKTGEKLVKVAKNGYVTVSAAIAGKPQRKQSKKVRKAKKTIANVEASVAA
jgi:hypothetical protein